ncbi:hypothetical protein, partial [Turicimonas muris]|uniref:hypothetical protein n=1 Tax=Turicimonas muris TaxID=1796652 RepID=UPI003F4DCDBC
LCAARAYTHAVNNVVESALYESEHVLARYAAHALGFFVVAAELLFEQSVRAFGFLLFTKLNAVFGCFFSARAVLTGSNRSTLHSAFFAGATLAFKEQFLPLSAALTTICTKLNPLRSLTLSMATTSPGQQTAHMLEINFSIRLGTNSYTALNILLQLKPMKKNIASGQLSAKPPVILR